MGVTQGAYSIDAMSWDGIDDLLGDGGSPTKRQRVLARHPEARRIVRELADSIYKLRIARGWTQADLAEAAGMTQSAVARFEGVGTVPTLTVLARLAEALNARLDVRLTPLRSAVADAQGPEHEGDLQR